MKIILLFAMVLLTAACNQHYRTVWKTTVENNNVPYQAARAKCRAIGQAAKIKAESEFTEVHKVAGTYEGGGFAGGFARGYDRSQFGNSMAEAAVIGCMAELNYVKTRMAINKPS